MFKRYTKKAQLNLGDKVVKVEKKKKKRVPLELRPYPELVAIADKLFALKVKKMYVVDEVATCYTCGQMYTWTPERGNVEVHNGHFVGRECHQLRWDFRNCRIQCRGCNSFAEGNRIKFEVKLKKEYDDETVDEMKRIGLNVRKVGREFVLEVIKNLKK
jgi:hypothetical protein